jgi:hypothetical protein
MKLLDKIFGHKWSYYKTTPMDGSDVIYLRHCSRCNITQQFRKEFCTLPAGWYTLVQFTDYGAKKHLKNMIYLEFKNEH